MKMSFRLLPSRACHILGALWRKGPRHSRRIEMKLRHVAIAIRPPTPCKSFVSANPLQRENFLDALSNSGPAVRLYSEGRAFWKMTEIWK